MGARSWPATALLALALASFAVALGAQKIRSFDYWFHLKTGERIAATGEVPKQDPYSFSVPGARWVDVHWLHQLGLHGLYRLGGHEAVVLGKGALALALAAALAWAARRRDRPALTAFAVGLGLFVASDRIMPRPELPTFVLLALELALLERFRARPDAWILALAPLHLVWANLHGLFAVGLAVAWAAPAAQWLDARLAGRPPDARRLRLLAAAAALASAACLVNPNGLDGVLYPAQQLLMIGPAESRAAVGLNSAELVPLVSGWTRVHPPLLAGFLALAALSLAALVANLRRLRSLDVFLWCAFFALALAAVRNLALFGVVAAPVLARGAAEVLDAHPLPRALARAGAAAAAAVLLACAGFVASGAFALRTGLVREPGLGVLEAIHPVGAVDFLAREHPPGPLYHANGDGGYLIWRLHPDYPVLSDGRLEVYGSRLRSLSDPSVEGFRALDREFHFGAALLSHAQFDFDALIRFLAASPAWRLAFADDAAVVFVRRRPGELSPDLGTTEQALFAPLPDDARSVSDLLRRQGRARLLYSLGRGFESRRYVNEVRLRYPGFAWSDVELAERGY